jgi:DNA-binding beta-propeller fold protein YncE
LLDITAGFGSVWVTASTQDTHATVLRIDPATNRVTARWHYVDGAGGGLAVGFGSLWLTQYNANRVLRIDPDTGRVRARIPVGLQPSAVHVAFGAVWVGNHHGQSVTEIGPKHNRVIATLPVGDPHYFRDGPQDITNDASHVYVGASVNQSLTTIDPVSNRVRSVWSTPADAMCGELRFVQTELWSVDHCSNALYHLRPWRRRAVAYDFGSGAVESETVFRHHLWVAYDTHPTNNGTPWTGGTLQERDPTTGRVLRTLNVGGSTSVVRSLTGNLWVLDADHNLIRRIQVS